MREADKTMRAVADPRGAADDAGGLDLLIEPAGIPDLEEVLAIEEASFSAPWTETMMRAEIEGNPFARFLLARRRSDRRLEGYVCYWVVFDELRLLNLAVAPRARRLGIGRALVRRALAEGRARGCARVLLEVRASNAPALALYDQFGLRRLGVRKRYYSNPTEDAILMELSLVVAPS